MLKITFWIQISPWFLVELMFCMKIEVNVGSKSTKQIVGCLSGTLRVISDEIVNGFFAINNIFLGSTMAPRMCITLLDFINTKVYILLIFIIHEFDLSIVMMNSFWSTATFK